MFSSFMANTWIAATMVAVVAGCVGFFVVIRGAAFAAHALPLGAFPGAALASLLGVDQLFGLIVFSGLGVAGISQLGRLAHRDVATAMTLVMLLGLGALFLSMTGAYAQGVYALLFGEVLGISRQELLPLATICALCVAAILLTFRPLLLSAAAPVLAETRGISRRVMELWFLAILALTTAAALPIVGALLVFSLTVAPAAAARSRLHRPFPAMLLSVAVAVAIVWAAIALSYVTNWPVGFFVGGLGILAYATGRLSAPGALPARRR